MNPDIRFVEFERKIHNTVLFKKYLDSLSVRSILVTFKIFYSKEKLWRKSCKESISLKEKFFLFKKHTDALAGMVSYFLSDT